MEAHIRRLTQEIRGESTGLISVLEEGCPVPSADIRQRQRRLIVESLTELDARLAVVIIGTGVGATLMRSVTRLLVPGRKQIRVTGEPRDAIEWVAPHVAESTAAELSQAVAQARKVAMLHLPTGAPSVR